MASPCITTNGIGAWLKVRRYMPTADLYVSEADAITLADMRESRGYRRGLLHACIGVLALTFLVQWVL